MPTELLAFGTLPSIVRIDVLTTFPEMFVCQAPGVLGVSIPKRAIESGKLEVVATDIRSFTHDAHHKTDDRPFGGGPGMVMMCQPVWDAVQSVEAQHATARSASGVSGAAIKARRVYLSPQGEPLTQALVEELAREAWLVMLCGHYEGIDERVIDALEPTEVSLGDFVVSGGEIAALVLIDAIARCLPGALGDEASAMQDSFSSFSPPEGFSTARDGLASAKQANRLLDCPQFTKPREWMGREVPEVLLSGDHVAIAKWRHEQRLKRTFVRRPDLMGR